MATINFNRPILKTKPHIRLQTNGNLLVYFVWLSQPGVSTTNSYTYPPEHEHAYLYFWKEWLALRSKFPKVTQVIEMQPLSNRLYLDAALWSPKS